MFARRTKPKFASLSVNGTMLSHPGCVREINEDVVAYVLPSGAASTPDRGMLALVADGMGGHAAGEVASRIAADTGLSIQSSFVAPESVTPPKKKIVPRSPAYAVSCR